MKIKYAFERVLYDRKQYKNLVPVLLLLDFEKAEDSFIKLLCIHKGAIHPDTIMELYCECFKVEK